MPNDPFPSAYPDQIEVLIYGTYYWLFYGDQGPQGPQGFDGSQGISGFQGFQGSQGPQGSQGFQGYQGWQGFQGLQGFQGVQGLQGFQGGKGFQGLQGDKGVSGDQGYRGIQGTGFQGLPGFNGDNGFQGVQGFQGAQGFQGWQGLQGFQGEAGLQGTTGLQGAKPAIVEVNGDWRALYCVESPNVRFEDEVVVCACGGEESLGIDPMFIKVCEPGSIVVIAAQSKLMKQIFAKISGDKIILSRPLVVGEKVKITMTGIRLGFNGVRFTKCSKEQAEENIRKWL